MKTPFHLAFPVKDTEETKKMYKEVLCCVVGRQSKNGLILIFLDISFLHTESLKN